MTLAEALAQDVPDRTRTKGNRYFLGGAVRSLEGSDSHVTATVRGTELYTVRLRREGDAVIGSCECPYFSDRADACKHLWAVVLAADASGYLVGNQPVSEDMYLEFEWELDTPPGMAAASPKAPARPAPWQVFLAAVQDRAARDVPAVPSRYANGQIQILYVIDRESTLQTDWPIVQVQWRVRKKSGEWGKPQPTTITQFDVPQLPEESDRTILSHLLGATESAYAGGYSSVYSRTAFTLSQPLAGSVLPVMAQSGRLHLRVAGEPRESPPWRSTGTELRPIAWDDGPPWSFRVDVAQAEGSLIRVDGTLARPDRVVDVADAELVTPGFVVVDWSLARLDAGAAFPWLVELRRRGPALVPPDGAPALVEMLARSGVEPAALPDALRYEAIEASPRPRIRIARSSQPHAYSAREELEATLQFEYAGYVVPGGDQPHSYDAETRRLIKRDRAAERSSCETLQRLGFHKPWYFGAREGVFAIAVDRFPAAVRALTESGWHVEAEGRMFRAARSIEMRVESGIDWFELHGRVDYGDGRSASMAELLAALRRGDATVLLDDGTRGLVPEDWLQRYARIAAFGEQAGDHVRYRQSQTALLDALLESQPAVRVDETFDRAREALARFSGVRPLDPPATFQGQLREYQREALGWFEFLRQFGFGGCLADDMGLGKTVMVLALLEARRLSRAGGSPVTSLAVVPRSLVFNWIEEASRFAPQLRVLDYTGTARNGAELGSYDLVLTTYGTLRIDAARLSQFEFDYVILDEAQAIKNAATASAKAARLLRGRHRLALSGTPIENHLGELWSLFEFLNPGLLGSASAFNRSVQVPARAGRLPAGRPIRTAAPVAVAERVERMDLSTIARALRPFILRRTKEEVAPELPPKFEQTIHCELEPAERRFYDELRAHYRQKLLAAVARKGMNRSKIQVLEALLRLRQAASHVGLVDPRRIGDRSSKFEMLLERLRELADEGHKALVFSQFTSLLGLLKTQLDRERITYEYLDGRTRDRAARVERFERDRSCPVFLISMKAGGLGLNLTAADYVFLLDPWWNPAVEAQAIDRTHRIGQTGHVFAYRLIARDTVEEKIAELQQSKRELADALLAPGAGLMRMLQPEDLEWLLT